MLKNVKKTMLENVEKCFFSENSRVEKCFFFFWEFPCWKMLKNVKKTMLKNVEKCFFSENSRVEKCWKMLKLLCWKMLKNVEKYVLGNVLKIPYKFRTNSYDYAFFTELFF